jgi:aminopeptidase
MDERYRKLAKILIDYSTSTKKGDKVLIHMKEVEAFPLAREVYRAAILKGAFPEVYFSSVHLTRDRLELGSSAQIKYYPKVDEASIKWADVWLGIRAPKSPYELEGIDPQKLAEDQKIYGRLADKRLKKCRWVLCWLPTEAFAQKAQMPIRRMEDFFFKATVKDWRKETEKYAKIRKLFQGKKEVRIVGQQTDISFSTEGRNYVIDDCHNNMPGGEVFSAPVRESVEGEIYFDIPSARSGQLVKDIRLNFRQGRVSDFSAKTGQPPLEKALEIDKGASYVGEFGIGANFGIKNWTLDILFDEKIGGTIHLALGRAYEECGGKNKSDLHWDLIKDLRKGGRIFVDGKLVSKNGKFLYS